MYKEALHLLKQAVEYNRSARGIPQRQPGQGVQVGSKNKRLAPLPDPATWSRRTPAQWSRPPSTVKPQSQPAQQPQAQPVGSATANAAVQGGAFVQPNVNTGAAPQGAAVTPAATAPATAPISQPPQNIQPAYLSNSRLSLPKIQRAVDSVINDDNMYKMLNRMDLRSRQIPTHSTIQFSNPYLPIDGYSNTIPNNIG